MSPEEAPRQVQFEFVNLAVSKAGYRLLSNKITPGPQPTPLNVVLQVEAAVKQGQQEGTAFITLDLKILPDVRWQPYEIEITIAAAFRSASASPEELLTFCRVAAPSILFPYVREYAHRLTMDAPYGAVKLNPTNIAQLLNQTDWTVSEADPVIPASSEPAQPSEQ